MLKNVRLLIGVMILGFVVFGVPQYRKGTFECIAGDETISWTTYEAIVLKVVDGDTVHVETPDGAEKKIRLYGIDAPEGGQDFFQESKENLAKMIPAGKKVTVKKSGEDRYRRDVGVVFADGVNVNAKQVQDGSALVYYKYCKASFCAGWEKAQDRAQKARLGLWGADSVIAPWGFREQKKGIPSREKSPTSLFSYDAIVDIVTTNATILGRAVGCGISIKEESLMMGEWLKENAQKDRHREILLIYMMGLTHNAELQAKGQSPDSCATIKRTMRETRSWPFFK